MSQPPYRDIRILEKSHTLTGRLVGLLFADQGADVFIERDAGGNGLTPGGHDVTCGGHDAYLDRNKIAVPPGGLADTSSADIIIVDGADAPTQRTRSQVLLRVTGALPGDSAYGHLSADCSEDLLNALVGIFTDMAGLGRLLGRPVIYTPLPICSVYAAVHGAIAVAAALVARERSGYGRDIITSRLAGGLSAIGVLTLTSQGIPEHLAPTRLGGVPNGLTAESFREIVAEAARDPGRQLWLAQRFSPLSTPFRAADGRLILPMVSPNRRLTERFLKALDVWDAALAAGMVSESCYDPAARQYAGRNLADAISLDFTHTSTLAELVGAAFARRPAAEWEADLCRGGVPCVQVQSWDEWRRDPAAHAARIFAPVAGTNTPQIGRSAWIASAQPYPPLECMRRASALPPRATPVYSAGTLATSGAHADDSATKPATATVSDATPRDAGNGAGLPLAGVKVVDLCNVVAGPACARVLVELGATVLKIDPMHPQHSPTIMVTFAGETAVGKRSIIVDTDTDEGRAILHRAVAGADLVMANKLDGQFARLGLDPASLAALNPAAIGVQLSAHRGEHRGPRHDYPGYDPALQGLTGIMVRFGPDGCPTFHGIASCVDYLCGYLGSWAAVTALVARERRQDGRGDWAEASLATAATLIQLLLQQTPEPASARGDRATGCTDGERVYKVADGWVFAQAPRNLSKTLETRTVAEALATLAAQGIAAVPVQTLRELADRHRAAPTTTVRFELRERDGWQTECFAPTWYAFDGRPQPRPAAPPRIGSDVSPVLADLGYPAADADRFLATGVVGPIEWFRQAVGV